LWRVTQAPIHRRASCPSDEGQEQLEPDLGDGVQQRARARATRDAQQERHQKRRDEHAEQARRRRAADGRRDVAARERGERDGGLHGGRQRAQVEHAAVQLGARERREQRPQREAEQREEREGAREDEQVQPHVAGAGQHGLTRELRAVQEEQQPDAHVRDPPEGHRHVSARRQQRGHGHHRHEAEREVVGQ
jgi:hypothetical protein